MKALLPLLLLCALPLHAQTTRIACGQSSPYTDSKGQVWQADADFAGGIPYSEPTAVTGTTDALLFQSQRYSRTDTPPLTYTIPLANGSYTLNLYFSEIYAPAATIRFFNVKANGTQILSDFNIAADAGGAFKADIKSFPVSVTNGSLAIEFDHQAGTAENPAVSAIEVIQSTAPQLITTKINTSLFWCTKCDNSAGDNIPMTGNLVISQNGTTSSWGIGADGSVSINLAINVATDPADFMFFLADANGVAQQGTLEWKLSQAQIQSNAGFMLGTLGLPGLKFLKMIDPAGNPYPVFKGFTTP